MKNRFGFIPIVLPVLVMVLIIGLINLAGPQAAQAQGGNVDEAEARLKSLTLKYDDADTTDVASIDIPLTHKGSGSEGFLSSVADYTATVDNAVDNVTMAGVAMKPDDAQSTTDRGYNVSYSSQHSSAADSTAGATVTSLAAGKTTLTIVTREQDVGSDTPKMATYTIELTKKSPAVGGNSPQLSALTVTYDGPPAESTGAALYRKDNEESQVTFSGTAVRGYVAFVPYTAQSFKITATGGDNTNKGPSANGVTISGDKVDGKTASDAGVDTAETETSTDSLTPGGSETYTITAKGEGAQVEYTLKVVRLYPQLKAVTLTDVSDNSAETILGFAEADLRAESSVVSVTRKIPYQVDKVTVGGVECNNTADDSSASCVLGGRETPGGTPPIGNQYGSTSTVKSTDADKDTTGHQVEIKSGESATVQVEVKHWLPTNSTADAASKGAEYKTTYNLKLERGKPVLADFSGNLPSATNGTGIHVMAGAGDPTVGPGNNLMPEAGAPDPKMTYKASIPYNMDYVTVRTNKGPEPGDGGDPIIVSITPSETNAKFKETVGHQVYIGTSDDPRKPTKITITVKSTKTQTRGVTTYTLEVTRGMTTLDDLNICLEAPPTCPDTANNVIPDVPLLLVPGTTTRVRDTAENVPLGIAAANNFIPTTTRYYAEMDYEDGLGSDAKARVTVEATPGTNRRAAFTMPAKSSNLAQMPLVVGNNTVKVDVGVNSSDVKPNTTTYEVTIKRSAPTPSVQFTLYDKGRNLLGEASYPFTLGPQSKSYDFVEMSSSTFDTNDFLFLNSIELKIGDIPDYGVTVSVQDGVQVREVSGQEIEVPASADLVTLEFEVIYKTGDGNKERPSTHSVIIRRPANSVPTFPANSALRDAEYTLLVGERFSPAGDNTPIELPYATGGNGALTYTVIGNEAKGTRHIPANLGYDPPSGSADGRMTGTPSILDESDGAWHHLILKVEDADGITDASDEDMINFSVRFVRDRSQITPSVITPPDVGELFDIEVKYDADGDSANGREKSAKLEPVFDPDKRLYLAKVPTDADVVDIHALASSSATVRLNTAETRSKENNVTRKFGTGTLHKWAGHQIKRGSSSETRNRYTLYVVDGGEDQTYTLDIVRELNTKPTFEDSAKRTFHFFEGIALGTSGDLPAKKMPLAVDGSGNGDTTTWMYSMKRRLKTSPNPTENDFLGLSLNAGDGTSNNTDAKPGTPPHKNPPYLDGTPRLDTDDPTSSQFADPSVVNARYTVQDSDIDEGSSDTASIDVDIYVYRNVALRSYSVDDDQVVALSNASRTYRSDLTYSYKNADLSKYTYNGVAHNAKMVTIEATVWDSARAKAVITPADADKDQAGHQVKLVAGPNPVTIRVTNGTTVADHVINIGRPGLQASSVTLHEYTDSRSGADTLTDMVTLMQHPSGVKGFKRGVMAYTAEVETWVSRIRVAATPVDPSADVSVDDFGIPDPPGYSVVRLPNMGEDTPNEITVHVTLEDTESESGVYTIDLVRKADTRPIFESIFADQRDGPLKRTVDRTLRRPIVLPKAAGGNGKLTYSVIAEELPDGLVFDPETREITGTPKLSQGYYSDFEVTYTVADADGNTAASDSDTQTFVIRITHENVSETDEPDPVVDPADRNKLSGLKVWYDQGSAKNKPATLSPAFSMNSGGPYTVRLPHNAVNVLVEPIAADTEATIYINNTSINSGIKHSLKRQETTIVVSHNDVAGEMTYTLKTVRTDDTIPTFGGATIEKMTFYNNEAIDPEVLPTATMGDGNLRYSLGDHEGRIPDGLSFSAGTQTLSGTPRLQGHAVDTSFNMTYTVMDENDDSASLTFMIRVCDPMQVKDCKTTVMPNPGATPIELEVTRTGDSATFTWTPGDDATRHLVMAVDPANLVASVNATIAVLGGDADSHTFTGLTEGVSYTYAVLGYDANGSAKDADGNFFGDKISE